MGNPLYFNGANIPASVAEVSTAQPDSPPSRLVQVGPKWERPWRSTTTAAQTGIISFTAGSQNIVAFVVYHANFTSIVVNGVTYTISADLDRMYKLFRTVSLSLNEVPFSIPVQATTPDPNTGISLPYFKLGRLFFMTAVSELEECPESISREIFDPQITAESELGVFDTLPAGSPYSRESWTGKYTADTLPNLRALFNRRAHQWVGLFRNLNTTRDYEFCFYHKEGGTRITYGNVTVDMDVSFRQSS